MRNFGYVGGGQLPPVGSAPAPAPIPAPTPSPTLPILTKLGQIGFNFTPDTAQGSPTHAFLDRMKSSGTNGLWSGSPPLSAFGYPTGINGGAPYANVALHPPLTGTTRYVFRHNGVGLVWDWQFVNNITIIDASDPKRVIFDVAPAVEGQGPPALFLRSATTWPDYKPNNPQANRDGISIYELALEANYLAGELFHPQALVEYKKRWSIRFMDANLTNLVAATTPADVTPVGNSSYSGNTQWGMPLEMMVALCNASDAHLWWNVPHAANDAYLTWAFGYIRDNLKPSLLMLAEYSNEVWNGDFPQSRYAAAFAKTLNAAWNENHGFGYLAAKMIKKARTVFGAGANRVFGLFTRQNSSIPSYTDAAIGAEFFEGKKTRDYFEAISCAFYGGGGAQSLVSSSSTAQQKQYMLDEVALYEATGTNYATRTPRQQLVDQMYHGNVVAGWGDSVDTLDNLAVNLQNAVDFAKAQGIRHFLGYEGQNFHSNASALGPVDGLRVNTMLSALANDPRISSTAPGSYMRQQYAMMRSKGMTGHNVYVDYGSVSHFGLWPTKRDVFAADTPLYAFYRYYNDTAPDQIAFSFPAPVGSDSLTLGAAATRVMTTYGGLAPASLPAIETGSFPPGMTLMNGAVTGTPNMAGAYTFSLSATDAGGRKVVSAPRTLTVAALTGYRYFRFTAKASIANDSSNSFFRVGAGEIVFKNGAAASPSAFFTATADVFSANPASHVADRDTSAAWISDQGQNAIANVGRCTIDTGEGAGLLPTSVDIYDVAVAPAYSINGVLIEASRNGATWVTVADVAVGAMTYVSRVANIALTLP